MAINAGTVYYTVDADTQKAIDSAAEMNKSLESVQTTMAKTDVQTKQYVKTLTDAKNTISKTGVVLDQFGNVNTEATAKMQKLMKTTESLDKRYIQLSKTAQSVREGLSRFGRGAGQAGIQVQQFIGQIQGGQGAMLALSQQSADLGFVLGAPLLGAVVGIGASLAGMLIPNLFKTTDALEDVEKATERVKAAITLSSEGITGYSEQMKVLAGLSQSLARVKLAGLIAEQTNAMKVARDSIKETSEDIIGLYGVTNKSVEKLFGSMSEQGMEAAIELRKSLNELSVDINTDSIERVTQALSKAEDQGLLTTESGRSLNSLVTNLIGQYRLGEITIKQFNEQLEKSEITFDDVGKAADKAANNQKKWADNAERLSVKTEELRSKQLELEKAIALKKATEEGATPETIKSMEASYNKIIANEKEIESEKALAKAKRDKTQAEKESKEASQNFIKNFGLSGEKDAFDPNAPESIANSESREIIEGNKTLQQALEERRGMTQYYYDNAIGDAETHAEALRILDQKIADEKQNTLDKQVKDQQAAAQTQMGIYNQLFSSMQSMTSNVLASMDEQSSGYKTMFAIQKAFAVAQAIVSAELAAAQVLAHDASFMGMGAIATSNMVRSMGYASAGVIAGTAIAGGRLYGGDVQAGSMYRVNEDGRPEVFNAANGQQYMLPNSRGEVVSNKNAGGGATVVTNNITINADGSASGDGDKQAGKLGKALQQATKQVLAQEMRQGGAIWQYLQKGKK